MSYLRIGPHILKPMGREVLQAMNPQLVVIVGAYEHQDAIDKHRAYVQQVREWLPNALIGVRWWPDDNILNTVSPEGYARLFFPLHMPGTLLFVGNEDANVHADPRVFADTVRKHTAVVRLANDAGVTLGTCCTSTGNPALTQYDLLAPLFQAMDDGRAAGVVHWWRLNRYFTATDASHIHEHEQVLDRVAKAAGVPIPPLLFGELGAVRSFHEPEAGYLVMDGFGIEEYVQRVADLDLPAALYARGVGVYDERWRHFHLPDKALLAFANGLPRTPFTAFGEWQRAAPPHPLGALETKPVTSKNIVNVRVEPSLEAPIKGQIKPDDVVGYRVGGKVSSDDYDWYRVESPLRGFVAAHVVTFGDAQPPVVMPPPDEVAQLRAELAAAQQTIREQASAIALLKVQLSNRRLQLDQLLQTWN